MGFDLLANDGVSTHSRPKAAGIDCEVCKDLYKFQHTAARRRLADVEKTQDDLETVSTHSRPKAAGAVRTWDTVSERVSTHSRPKAAGRMNPKS